MSILSDFEDRVGGALEGVFAGVFRSPVQPVEIARALSKAMDDGRSVGVGKVYAPLGYLVALSPEDAEKFGSFTTTLSGELATYLADHARERGYTLVSAPHVAFDIHDDLRLGRFRVSAELAAPEGVLPEPGALVHADEAPLAVPDRAPAPVPAPAAPAFFDAEAPERAAGNAEDDGFASSHATVTVGDSGHDAALTGDRVLVGRLHSSGIHLEDANASREHAAFVREGAGWAIEDLGSTNGTYLNGHQVKHPSLLHEGDVIEIGVSRLTYHEPGR